jgi:hypothetical protein
LTSRSPTIFGDEDEAPRIKPGLLDLQLGTRCSDIRTILFSGVQSFF